MKRSTQFGFSIVSAALVARAFVACEGQNVEPSRLSSNSCVKSDDCDGDGHIRAVDCNDFDSQTHSGAAEIPGNYQDDNCDGFTDEPPLTLPADAGGAQNAVDWPSIMRVDESMMVVHLNGVYTISSNESSSSACRVFGLMPGRPVSFSHTDGIAIGDDDSDSWYEFPLAIFPDGKFSIQYGCSPARVAPIADACIAGASRYCEFNSDWRWVLSFVKMGTRIFSVAEAISADAGAVLDASESSSSGSSNEGASTSGTASSSAADTSSGATSLSRESSSGGFISDAGASDANLDAGSEIMIVDAALTSDASLLDGARAVDGAAPLDGAIIDAFRMIDSGSLDASPNASDSSSADTSSSSSSSGGFSSSSSNSGGMNQFTLAFVSGTTIHLNRFYIDGRDGAQAPFANAVGCLPGICSYISEDGIPMADENSDGFFELSLAFAPDGDLVFTYRKDANSIANIHATCRVGLAGEWCFPSSVMNGGFEVGVRKIGGTLLPLSSFEAGPLVGGCSSCLNMGSNSSSSGSSSSGAASNPSDSVDSSSSSGSGGMTVLDAGGVFDGSSLDAGESDATSAIDSGAASLDASNDDTSVSDAGSQTAVIDAGELLADAGDFDAASDASSSSSGGAGASSSASSSSGSSSSSSGGGELDPFLLAFVTGDTIHLNRFYIDEPGEPPVLFAYAVGCLPGICSDAFEDGIPMTDENLDSFFELSLAFAPDTDLVFTYRKNANSIANIHSSCRVGLAGDFCFPSDIVPDGFEVGVRKIGEILFPLSQFVTEPFIGSCPACVVVPTDGGALVDASAQIADAGTQVDAAVTLDASQPSDASAQIVDAGVLSDAGNLSDASTQVVDAGSPFDAGDSKSDSGTIQADAAVLDASQSADANVSLDAGVLFDAAVLSDAGTQVDAAVTLDASQPSDASAQITDAGVLSDAGNLSDASAQVVDAGNPFDAGDSKSDSGAIQADAAVLDAGQPTDAGVSLDAGTQTDAAVALDASQSFDAGTQLDAAILFDASTVVDAGSAEIDSGALSDAGASIDASAQLDGSAIQFDASVNVDAGSSVDAAFTQDAGIQSADASGSVDAGASIDASVLSDAGASVDASIISDAGNGGVVCFDAGNGGITKQCTGPMIPPDAGAVLDAGGAKDSIATQDAGSVVDASIPPDAGSLPDAGPPPPAAEFICYDAQGGEADEVFVKVMIIDQTHAFADDLSSQGTYFVLKDTISCAYGGACDNDHSEIWQNVSGLTYIFRSKMGEKMHLFLTTAALSEDPANDPLAVEAVYSRWRRIPSTFMEGENRCVVRVNPGDIFLYAR